MKPTSFIADFDSSAAMLRALGNYLHGRDFPLLGAMPRWKGPAMRLFASLVTRMPKRVKEQIYIWSGWLEAVPTRKMRKIDVARITDWATSVYPKRKYPAIAIGSANGALTHLWAALGIPWLPQTFLIPVARSGPDPDEPQQDLDWARVWADVLLEANPDVQLHHLHDPNQDRLMIQHMSYFRVKELALAAAYRDFIRQRLEPGGTIFIVECGLKWPTTRFGERHVFQFGALGGATPDEYHHGGKRVEDYLARYGSRRRVWVAPEPDAERPEAEWGFEPRLGEDIARFARENDFRIRRVLFEHPEHASPFVADLYRWWNRQRAVTDDRLLVESFIVMEPYWTVRTGSAPFWMVFNKEPSAAALKSYLDAGHSFDEIAMMLFSHGVDSVGLASIETWRGLLKRATQDGFFVGVDERAYPRDFAVFVRYYYTMKRMIKSRYPMPHALTLEQLDEFVERSRGRYALDWA